MGDVTKKEAEKEVLSKTAGRSPRVGMQTLRKVGQASSTQGQTPPSMGTHQQSVPGICSPHVASPIACHFHHI